MTANTMLLIFLSIINACKIYFLAFNDQLKFEMLVTELILLKKVKSCFRWDFFWFWLWLSDACWWNLMKAKSVKTFPDQLNRLPRRLFLHFRSQITKIENDQRFKYLLDIFVKKNKNLILKLPSLNKKCH